MVSSLAALLAGIIDYAGLFPPARLPLGPAIHAYARYQQGPYSWTLGRFLCPTERFAELGPLIPPVFRPDHPLRLGALGRGGKTAAEFWAALRADAAAIGAFRDHHQQRTQIEAYEVRVPDEVLATGAGEAAGKLLKDIGQVFEQSSLLSLTAYFEAAPSESWRSSMAALNAALAQNNPQRVSQRRHKPAGFKLRCGGLQAGDFPSPEQVAYAITACRDSGVPLKFTAGLHHPIRRFDPGVQTFMHGFLNVFTAGVLAHARQLREDQVRRIIEAQDSEEFSFDDDGLRWKDSRATVEETRAARRFVISFGCCSFEEPCEDLQAMGLLP